MINKFGYEYAAVLTLSGRNQVSLVTIAAGSTYVHLGTCGAVESP